MENTIDIKENYKYTLSCELLSILLKDRTTEKNIIWATDNYSVYGYGYQSHDQITVDAITGRKNNIIRPRVEKSKKEQMERIRDRAEVFTPSWVCNKQNNLVDNAWFGEDFVFNTEIDKTWISQKDKIIFPTPSGKTWKDYILDTRLEITCGEAPYLVSRYDTVSGNFIDIENRIGLLDRKLRIVTENTKTEKEWMKWAITAFQNIYGFDFQGDNVLLARKNLFYTFIDYYTYNFKNKPDLKYLKQIAVIISWNIWQMDAIAMTIPYNDSDFENLNQMSFFVEDIKTGYCKIKDWQKKEVTTFKKLTEVTKFE